MLNLGPFEPVEVSYFFKGVWVLLKDESLLRCIERCIRFSKFVEVLLILLVSLLRALSSALVLQPWTLLLEAFASAIAGEIPNLTWCMLS